MPYDPTPEKIADYASKRSSTMSTLLVAYLNGAATLEETDAAIRTINPTLSSSDEAPKPAMDTPEYAEWYQETEDNALGSASTGDYPDLDMALNLGLITADEFGQFQSAFIGA
jgi:hypothetical protein